TQMHNLLEILDALGNHIHAHVARKIDKCLDDGRRIAISTDGIHEHLVNLDDINTELQHVGQAAMACAHIIDCDANAETLQGRDGLPGFGEILDRITLGDFEYDL